MHPYEAKCGGRAAITATNRRLLPVISAPTSGGSAFLLTPCEIMPLPPNALCLPLFDFPIVRGGLNGAFTPVRGLRPRTGLGYDALVT